MTQRFLAFLFYVLIFAIMTKILFAFELDAAVAGTAVVVAGYDQNQSNPLVIQFSEPRQATALAGLEFVDER